MAHNRYLNVESDTLLIFEDVKDRAADAFITDAVLTVVELLNPAGTDVLGGAIVGAYVAGTDATYHVTIPDTVVLVKDTDYTAKITFVKGSLKRTLFRRYRAREELQ